MISQRYPHVISPINIGPVEVRNRLYMPPHGLALTAAGPHGSAVPSDDCAYYYAERVEAGVGLVFHSLSTIPRHRLASPLYEDSVPHFKAVADMVHAAGGKIMGQLHYYWGHTVPWEPLGAMFPVFGTDRYQRFEKHDTVHQLSEDEIRAWIEAHGRCARNLRDAGYDGIQVHAAHGMLAEQFLSRYYNKRTDRFGGDLESRMRVLVEALESVRANVSQGMAVGIRFNCDEMLPQGVDQDEAGTVLDKLVEMDLIHYADLDIAVEPQQAPLMVSPRWMPPLHIASFIASVGRVVKGRTVVMGAAGRVTTLAEAEDLIASGTMDLVGAVRGLIAEPELLRNALEGREDRNRTCIACNFCIGSFQQSTGWGCVINPGTGRERRWGLKTLQPQGRSQKVVVVGGGPAGMEAARVAARRGHQVLLLEGADRLGGQMELWSRLPGRELLAGAVDWYRRAVAETGVEVRLGTAATVDGVLAEQPDAVIVATGARYVRNGQSGFMPAEIPGWDLPFVHTPEEILGGGLRPKGRVLVLDEEQLATGLGLAELLAESGAQVEVVTREMSPVGPALWYSFEFPYLLPKLERAGVKLTTRHYLKEIRPGRATLFEFLTNDEVTRDVDAVILATMRRQAGDLDSELYGRVPRLYVVGDALAPRALFEATFEGQRFARLIDDPDAPKTTSEALFQPSGADVHPKGAASLLE